MSTNSSSILAPTVPALNRIIIGDVGSGKTIVAFFIGLGFLNGIEEGSVALLAPTEVLAYQHNLKLLELKTMSKGLIDDITVIMVVSKQRFINGETYTKSAFEKQIKVIKSSASKQFWIGTHALLERETLLPQLILIDEQHRFGVKQRKTLSHERNQPLRPHYISLTATPIPRTLALSIFRSLQPHFLEMLPRGNPITTKIKTFEQLESDIIPKLKNEINNGKKAYIILSRVEEDESDDQIWSIQKATKWFEQHFPGQILTIHGKVKEKSELLQQFKTSYHNPILIATTVVEVGVDVPEATLIIILNAERFGLAALHQLRGRIGRNQYDNNYCYLVTTNTGQYSKRLRYMTDLTNGFALAEKDLELRGQGDLIGTKQSGYEEDIETLIGLKPQLYERIAELVSTINFEDLHLTLPRLSAYLEKTSRNIWEE